MILKPGPTFVTLLLMIAATSGYSEPLHTDEQRVEPIEEILVRRSRGGDFTIITEQAQNLVDMPGAIGDPLMAVFSLPGIVFGDSELGSDPAVRGSSPADNLYLVDGLPAGYVFHAFSTSVFNENIINDFDLYSAGFGARYGNATGAVFDISLRQPKNQALSTTLDLSFLRAGVFLEGGVTDNSAFYLSVRSSLLHHFIDEDDLDEDDGIRLQTPPRDSDYQFKYAWQLNDQDSLTLSANGAKNRAGAEFTSNAAIVRAMPDVAGDAHFEQKFDNQGLHWHRRLPAGAELRLSVGHYSNQDNDYWGQDYYIDSRNQSYLAKSHYSTPLNDRHTLSVGADWQNMDFRYDARLVIFVCTELDPDCISRRGETISVDDSFRQNHYQFYINDYWAITDTVNLDAGLQWQHNSYTGENFVHPRLAAAWTFAPSWTLTGSAGSYNRAPDLEYLLPEVGNPQLKSPTANHYTLGLKQELANRWSWNLEFYYKTLDNLPQARDPDTDTGPLYTNNTSGEAYGVDLLINKGFTDRWYGWLSLSYARSTRQYDGGETMDYPLDTPLIANLVMQYQLTENWDAGFRFTARSGQTDTPIIGIQDNPHFEDSYLPVYGVPYSKRLPTYQRLDVRVKRALTLFGYDGSFTIDVINALNTRNVLARDLDYKRVDETGEMFIEDEISLEAFLSLGFSITF